MKHTDTPSESNRGIDLDIGKVRVPVLVYSDIAGKAWAGCPSE